MPRRSFTDSDSLRCQLCSTLTGGPDCTITPDVRFSKTSGKSWKNTKSSMGIPRGRLAVTMDLIADAMAFVGQHGGYCQSQRWPGKPVMDIQIIMTATD